MAEQAFEARLGYRFSNPALLREALTHRSYGLPHNERFEFLGDSILNCVMSIALCARFPQLREGELSRVRASLVRQEALHRIACNIGLGEAMRLGEGELKSGGRKRPSILADALEAVFAAVYLDSDFEQVKGLINRLAEPLLTEVDPQRPAKDAKTALQEWLQGRRLALPQYRLVQTLGEAHAQEFEVVCEIPGRGLSTHGRGPSRRIAEQQSAELALQALRKQ